MTEPLWGLAEARAMAPGQTAGQYLRHLSKLPEGYRALPVASGSVALMLALTQLGVGPGDRVAVNAMCCRHVVSAMDWVGARPVYVDCLPGSFLLSPESLRRVCDAREPRAVIAAHFQGQRSDMPRIAEFCRERGLGLIDDSAYLAGLRFDDRLTGTSGDWGVWSFSQKLLSGCYGGAVLLGPAGAVADLDRQLADKPASSTPAGRFARLYVQNVLRRAAGSAVPGALGGRRPPKPFTPDDNALNPRPAVVNASPRQCEVMRAQLARAEDAFQRTMRSYAFYRDALAGRDDLRLAELPRGGCFPRTVPLACCPRDPAGLDTPARLARVLRIREHLFARGIQTMAYAPVWYGQPDPPGETTHTAAYWPDVVYIPCHPLLSARDLRRVVGALKSLPDVTR